jgi:hypothetical protein
MPYKISPIYRGQKSLQSDARSLLYTASHTLADREDDELVVAVKALELECYQLAKQANDFAAFLRKLPRCPLCNHMADAECPHDECIAEE